MSEQQHNSAQNPLSDPFADMPSRETKPAHLLSTEGFVTRLAQELRAKGDPDLPLNFYAEQARQLLLSGKHPKDISVSSDVPRAVNDDVYQSWALSRS